MALPESAHPYADNTSDFQEYTVPGSPVQIAVTFDALCEVGPTDQIYVEDADFDDVPGSPFSGTDLAGQTFLIDGDTFSVDLETGLNPSALYGYKVTSAVISIAAPPPVITTVSPIKISQGLNANFSFGATGVAPFTWAVITGTLPTGLTLASDGTLTGTPSDPVGTSVTVTIQVTDNNGAPTSADFVFTVTLGCGKPKTVHTFSTPSGYAGFGNPGSGNRVGPFFLGGDRYVAFVDSDTFIGGSGTFKIRVKKAVGKDITATWTELDSTNAPTIINSDLNIIFSAASDGTDIYVFYAGSQTDPADGVGNLITFMQKFSIAAGLWSTISTGGPQIPKFGSQPPGFPVSFVPALMSDYLPITDAFVLAYTAPWELVTGVTYTRCAISKVSKAGSWGSSNVRGTGTTNFYDIGGVTVGAGDRAHLFYLENSSRTGTSFKHVTFTISDTFGAEQDITLPGGDETESNNFITGLGAHYNDGTDKLCIPFWGLVSFGLYALEADDADDPTWTSTLIGKTMVGGGQVQLMSAVFSGAKLFIFSSYFNLADDPNFPAQVQRYMKVAGVWTGPDSQYESDPVGMIVNVSALDIDGTPGVIFGEGTIQFSAAPAFLRFLYSCTNAGNRYRQYGSP